jgi:hypothetical protein
MNVMNDQVEGTGNVGWCKVEFRLLRFQVLKSDSGISSWTELS